MACAYSRRLAAIATIGLTVAVFPVVPAVASERSDHDVLVELAHRYLQDRADRVTSGYTPINRSNRWMLTTAATTETFTARIAAESPGLDHLRSRFSGTLTEFSHAQVTIERADTEVKGSTAELMLTESTDLHLASARSRSFAPVATSYRLGHTLRFERVNKEWRLSADVLDLPKNALDPIPYFRAEKSRAAEPGEVSPLPPVPADVLPMSPGTPRKPRAVTASLTPNAAFNRGAAIDYAVKWAKSRNSYYNAYSNDCTNFLSQILRAGGWTNVGGIEGPDKWWHIPPKDSRSWRIAHELMWFGHHFSNRFRPYAGEPVRVGDAVFSDWNDATGRPGTDGKIDHAMFVTLLFDSYDWEGIFVSYHTTDQVNISMAAVVENVQKLDPNFGGLYYFMDTR